MIYKKEKLSKYSWFNLGGEAEIFFKPNSEIELKEFLNNYKSKKYKMYILGAGSNTLFRDSGFKGVIIKLGNGFSQTKLIGNNKIEIGAATLDRKVSDFAMNNSISGFEFLSCIPGSIGGAILMNSGCYKQDISNIFYSLKAMNFSGEIKNFNKHEIEFSYRGCNIPKDLIILSVVLAGQNGDKKNIEKKMNKFITNKKNSQPSRIKTCGSTFKNTKNKKAWELIKFSDCKKLEVGGASISEKHCNFFVNNGTATATDVEKLINEVQKKVFLKTKEKLELEIKIVGDK